MLSVDGLVSLERDLLLRLDSLHSGKGVNESINRFTDLSLGRSLSANIRLAVTPSPIRQLRRVPAEVFLFLGRTSELAVLRDFSPVLMQVVEVATNAKVNNGSLHSTRGGGLEGVDVSVGFYFTDTRDRTRGDATLRVGMDVDGHDADTLLSDSIEVFGLTPAICIHFIEAFHHATIVDVGKALGPDALGVLTAGLKSPFDAVIGEGTLELFLDGHGIDYECSV